MKRLLAALAIALASLAPAGLTASASCGVCVSSVALQTRDGLPWSNGKPVTLVISVDHAAGTALPASALAVVMQTDGDRTKCLDVPLKLVRSDGTTGVYAGLFFPFRAARFDGKLAIGDDVSDLAFDVTKMVSGAAPAGELPAAERIDTSAPPLSFVSGSQLPLAGGVAIAFWSLVALALYARRRVVASEGTA
ncbi:MAG: hypothetical protein HY071_06460 [Chloroflexi bacterium]|nr:hypothetical protein [Chloroflexota bacterium]